jgi:uncharacterized membrane protein
MLSIPRQVYAWRLGDLAPNLLTYLLSFMTLGIFWVGQHTQISKLKHSDRALTWIHLAFLLMVTLVPFITKLLAAFRRIVAFIVLVQLNYVVAPRIGFLRRI